MGLKLRWFRANVDIARPNFRSRTTELASPSSPSSTFSVNGFYVQRNFEHVEDQIKPPPPTRPAGTEATSAGVRTTERDERRQRQEPTRDQVPSSAPNNTAKKQTPPIPAPAQRSKQGTPNGTAVNQQRDGATVPKKSTKPKPPDVPTNETTNPIFGFLTTKRKPRGEEAMAAKATDGEASAAKGKKKDNERNREKGEPKKTENAKSPKAETGETSKGGKSAVKEGAKAPSKRDQKAAKKTREFAKMKDKKAPKPTEAKKVEHPNLSAVDPNAPSARNPLLRYGEGRGASGLSNNSPAGDVSEEEFLRTGNISVKTSASTPKPMGAKMTVSRNTVFGGEDDDEEYDA